MLRGRKLGIAAVLHFSMHLRLTEVFREVIWPQGNKVIILRQRLILFEQQADTLI